MNIFISEPYLFRSFLNVFIVSIFCGFTKLKLFLKGFFIYLFMKCAELINDFLYLY